MENTPSRFAIRIMIVLLFLVCTIGCSSETKNSFPKNYMAEDYSLPDDFLAISATSVRDGVFYFSVIKDISGNKYLDVDTAVLAGELRYIDFSAESASHVTIPYPSKGNDFINHIFPNHDGTLSLVIQNYDERKGARNPVITETVIKKISLHGEELFSYSIMEDVRDHANIYITGFIADHSGNTYLIISDTLYVFHSAGELNCTIRIPGAMPKVAQSLDGTAYLFWLGASGFEMAAIDIENGNLAGKHALRAGQIYLDVAAGMSSDFLLAAGDGIYEYDISQGAEEKIISFSELDIAAGFGGALLPLTSDSIAWLQMGENKNRFTVIHGALEAELSQKNTLIMGGTFNSFLPWHYEAVANFNKTSSDVRIEIKTYGSDGVDDGMARLNMDIATGQGPDIMILPRHFSMDLYAGKGVLTDLYPYIDGDEEMERSDFQENILRAYEIDGKLYGIPIIYWIHTMAAPRSLTGHINQWSLDEMMHFADRYMPGSTVFSWANKSSVLSICLMANGDSLIDWSDEGHGFHKELLVKILTFADRFLPDDTYSFDEELIERNMVHGQLQIISHEYVSGFTDHQKFSGIFGEPASYPGYPSENGNGNLIDSNYVMAINSSCDDKDAAWQFISSLLTEEYQWSRASIGDFPIRKSVLEQKMAAEMKAYYENDENGLKKEEKRWSISIGSEKIDIYAAKEEDIQAILAVISSADKIRIWNGQVSSIVYEEARAFFSGNKAVEEVVDITENRIRIYINEMK